MRTAIVSTLVSLLCCELVLRIVMPQPLVVPINEQFLGVAAPTPSSRSRVELPGQYDTAVTINAAHFRMPRPTPLAATPGSTRVAMLGDSVTFGVGANDDETYPAVAERLLTRARARSVDVINAGVVATGTGEQLLWYTRWVSTFHPDVVVLNVFFNDVDDDAGRRLVVGQPDGTLRDVSVSREPSRIRTWVRRSRAYRALVAHSQLAGLVRLAAGRIGTEMAQPMAQGARFDEGLALQAREVGWLNAAAAANGARLVVVSIPVKQIFYPDDAPSRDDRWKSEAIARSLGASCASAGIPFLDLTAALRDAVRASPTRLYFTNDSHPTPAGYRAIAAAVSSFLEPMLAPAESGTKTTDRQNGATKRTENNGKTNSSFR